MQDNKINRIVKVQFLTNPLHGSAATFIWGARQVGKTTHLLSAFPNALMFDLLKSEVRAELSTKPSLFRERVRASKAELIIVDEIQKVPALQDEIHWLLENSSKKFILCGSSARKLKREAKNLLGGRAINCFMFPLTTQEIVDFNLESYLKNGGLPVPYLSEDAKIFFKAYINNYLQEEIIDESIVRNIPSFAKFLEIVALTHGQQLNYSNVAREAGVSPSTVRSYYQILKDTLLGFELEPWRKKKNRRLVDSSKMFLFDVGLANHLHPEFKIGEFSVTSLGHSFEHFLLNEVRAYLSYSGKDLPISYWRTHNGIEVDLIIGDMQVALEFKSALSVGGGELKGMRSMREEFKPQRAILVSRDAAPRLTDDGIEILPWKQFCAMLWAGQII